MNRNYHNDLWQHMEFKDDTPPATLLEDHAQNPRNFGDMSEGFADSYVSITDPSCGETVELWIIVEEGRIFDIRFKSNGCASTLAANSMMTQLALGKTIEEAKHLTDQDVVAAFQEELVRQSGCPLAGVQALHRALEQYEKNHEQAG
jgi:nitrogen fixation NifU-like protein